MKNIEIKYSQKQTPFCSFKLVVLFFLVLIVYGFFAMYNALPSPGLDILIPVGISVIWIPLQALLFDWFQADGKSLAIKEDEIIYTYSPSRLFQEMDKVKVFKADDIKKIRTFFKKFDCLRTVEIIFKGNKKLYLRGFYIEETDFANILHRLE